MYSHLQSHPMYPVEEEKNELHSHYWKHMKFNLNTRQELVIIRDTQEKRQMVANITSLRIHQDVPEKIRTQMFDVNTYISYSLSQILVIAQKFAHCSTPDYTYLVIYMQLLFKEDWRWKNLFNNQILHQCYLSYIVSRISETGTVSFNLHTVSTMSCTTYDIQV